MKGRGDEAAPDPGDSGRGHALLRLAIALTGTGAVLLLIGEGLVNIPVFVVGLAVSAAALLFYYRARQARLDLERGWYELGYFWKTFIIFLTFLPWIVLYIMMPGVWDEISMAVLAVAAAVLTAYLWVPAHVKKEKEKQMEDVYEELRRHLDKHPSGAPEGPGIHEILSMLFTPEEARVACGTSFRPKPVSAAAERSGVTGEEASARLESMADKGLVYAREKNGEWGYALLPIMPGIFEFPYMKGEKDEHLSRLAGLWETYLMTHARDMIGSGKPFARVVAIQEEVENDPRVLTYEMVDRLIDEAGVVGISHCACRTAFAHCDGPLEACMLFDETCTYLVERGYARYITKEEMKKMLREFDQMGLVHNVNNSRDKLQFICNCCSCCCGFLRVTREVRAPYFLATSGFMAQLEEDLCTGCAACEDRCPMDAIEMTGELPVIDQDRCIGCALCVTGCDTDAMSMKRREDLPETPSSMPELGLEVLRNRGRLEEFIEVMR